MKKSQQHISQEELHRKFIAMMECFVEKFLGSMGVSLDWFYEAVRAQMQLPGTQGESDSNECLDVLFEMADVRVWVDGMKARARRRLAHDPGFILCSNNNND